MTESLSHIALRDYDTSFKGQSFRSVSEAQLDGGTARPDFARFFTDYTACRTRFGDPDEASLATTDKLDTHELCNGVFRHAEGFYYNAKNLVYRQDTFQKELTTLQSRINFVRSTTAALILVTIQLLIAVFVAAIAEAVHQREHDRPFLARTMARLPYFLQKHLRRHWSWAPKLGSHWQKFDTIRCSFFLVGAACCSVLAFMAWHDCENQFDKRVYGYFLTMGKEEVAEVTPQSTYHLFAIDKLHSFEPSGVQPLGQSPRVIVVNDKGQGSDDFVVFDRGAPPEEPLESRRSGKSVEAAAEASGPAKPAESDKPDKTGESHQPDKTEESGEHDKTEETSEEPALRSAQVSAGRWDVLGHPRVLQPDTSEEQRLFKRLGKLESVHTREADDAHPGKVEVFAASTFASGDKLRNIVHFYLDPDNLEVSEARLLWTNAQTINPCSVVRGRDPQTGAERPAKSDATCVIEGMITLDDSEGPAGTYHFILGVRFIGDGRKDDKPSPIVALVALDVVDGVPKLDDTPLFQNDAIGGSQSRGTAGFPDLQGGISDLEVVKDSLYVLTSYENQEPNPCVAGPRSKDALAALEINQVCGKLWRVPFARSSIQNRKNWSTSDNWHLVEEFIHKPEGIGRTLEGSLLVVFDDDASRKSMDLAPATFPLEQNEAVLAVVGPQARKKFPSSKQEKPRLLTKITRLLGG